MRTAWSLRSLSTKARRAPFALLPGLLAPLGVVEDRRLRRVRAEGAVHPPPVFIVGAPRTGSTIYYQAVTNTFRVGYLSTLSAFFFRSPSLGTALHRRLLGERPHECFRSEHGRGRGAAVPSETGKLWYRWFPRDRDFVTAGEVPRRRLDDLRRTVALLTADAGTPFVFKNLNCGQRLQAIHEVIPEALVVFIRRDPLGTALSLLRAREEVSGGREHWVSVRPPDHAALRTLSWPEQIAGQIHSLERRIHLDLARFPPGQVLRVEYEDFCADPAAELGRFAALLAAHGAPPRVREGASVPQVRSGAPAPVGEDAELLRAAIDRLDWSQSGRRG